MISLQEIIQEEIKKYINEHGYDPRKMWPNSYLERGDGDWMDFFLDTEVGTMGGFGFKPKSRTFTQRVKEVWVENILDAENIKKDSLRAVQDVQARVESIYHAYKGDIDNYIGECGNQKKGEGVIARQLYKLYNKNGHSGPINNM